MGKRIRTVDDIPARWRNMAPDTAVSKLRFEARLAWLDDRVAQAKKFNKYADIIARAQRAQD